MVSIDLGYSKVAVALGEMSADGQTIVKRSVVHPMSGMERGEISNIERVTSSIKAAVEELEAAEEGLVVERVVVGASGRSVLCADKSGVVYVAGDGEIMPDDVRQLKENMQKVQAPEGRVILDRIPQSYKIDTRDITDSNPVGMFGRQLATTYSFILAGKAPLERIGKALDRVGITKSRFYASAMASGVVAATADEKELGVAVVDMGAGTTDLCIYQGGVVRYVASIPLGSADIDNDIKAVAIPPHAVEKVKIKYGYASAASIPFENLNQVVRIKGRTQREKSKDISFRDLSSIIECRLLDIVDYLVEELRRSGYNDKLAAGMVLTGGCSQLMGIDSLLRERTGHEVRFGGAEEGISAESMEGFSAPELSCVIGLLRLAMLEGGIKSRPATEPAVAEEEDEQQPKAKGKKEKPARRGGGGQRRGLNTLWNKIQDMFFTPPIEPEDENIDN